MKLTIISGSQRPQSQSLNVANVLKQLAHSKFDDINIIDLHQLALPFWNEGVWNDDDEWQRLRSRIFCYSPQMKRLRTSRPYSLVSLPVSMEFTLSVNYE